MLLNIYLGTTALSWATVFIVFKASEKKLKRDGYKFVEEKNSFSEKVLGFISNAFMCSIPVYNIINIIAIFCMGNKIYEYMEEKLLEKGAIYKPTAEKSNDIYKNEEKADTYIVRVQKTRTIKTYDEMTIEEKLDYLQQEKEKLINHATSQVENPYILIKKGK